MRPEFGSQKQGFLCVGKWMGNIGYTYIYIYISGPLNVEGSSSGKKNVEMTKFTSSCIIVISENMVT